MICLDRTYQKLEDTTSSRSPGPGDRSSAPVLELPGMTETIAATAMKEENSIMLNYRIPVEAVREAIRLESVYDHEKSYS